MARLRCHWLAPLVVLLGLSARAVAVDDVVVDDAPQPAPAQKSPVETSFDGKVFGEGPAAAAARIRMETLLAKKIDAVDRCCGLSDVQKRKLQLAGRGDLKRYFDQVEQARSRAKEAGFDDQRIASTLKEIDKLRESLVGGPFDEGSLFHKVLGESLSGDQFARYEALRRIDKLGGRVLTRGRGLEAEVRLENTKVTDHLLAQLHGLSNVTKLYLWRTKISDGGLAHLTVLVNLQVLDLSGTQVTDAGLVYLAKLPELRVLDLYSTQVTDAGAVHLQGLTKLNQLNLSRTRVGDAGLVHFRGLSDLRHLNLAGTQVTDAGLPRLYGLANLRSLALRDTKVTPAGIAELKRNLPRVNVAR